MQNIYDEEALEKLEEKQHDQTLESLLILIALASVTRGLIEDELRSFYQRYGKDGVVTYAEARKWVSSKNRKRRLNTLLFAVQCSFLNVYPEVEFEFRDMVMRVMKLELDFFGVDIDLTDLPLRWGFDNLDWVDRLHNDISKWVCVIQSDIKRGILQRKHLNDILADVEKRFKSIESVLESLSVSETTAVGSIARHEILRELGIDKYKFYTRADERTCETCGAMHGLIFPMSAYEVGVTASPMHPRCRCWEVPIKSE